MPWYMHHPNQHTSSRSAQLLQVESFSAGFLGAIVVEEGGVANVGAAIAFVAETEAEIEAAKDKAGGSAAGSASNGASAPPPAAEVLVISALRGQCLPCLSQARLWPTPRN